jgi:hypothetical protein
VAFEVLQELRVLGLELVGDADLAPEEFFGVGRSNESHLSSLGIEVMESGRVVCRTDRFEGAGQAERCNLLDVEGLFRGDPAYDVGDDFFEMNDRDAIAVSEGHEAVS